MHPSTLLSLSMSFGSALAAYKGFNYGSTSPSGAVYAKADYETLFKTAAGLEGTSGFTAARLYTMIQGGTADTVISAVPAAISTKTYLLLGLWASEDQAAFNNELTALKNTITQFGTDLAPLLVGISVGSEDLYRDSDIGKQAGVTDKGAQPSQLIDYIGQVRAAIKDTALGAAKIGHVDTWNSWTNSSNSAVISAVDWLGVDAYPYFQNTEANAVSDGQSLFKEAFQNTANVAAGKEVWVTETGWPVSGKTENLAVASTANSQTFWNEVGCNFLFDKYNTFWYTLQDYGSSPSFGVVGEPLSTTPLFDLSCSAAPSSASSSSAGASSTSTSAVSIATSSTQDVVTNPVATGTGLTRTVWETEMVTVTSCPPKQSGAATVQGCGAVLHPNSSTSSVPTGVFTTIVSVPTVLASSVTSTTSAAASSTACPANLSGAYQYPHLIVPVNSASPDTAYGTQYNGTVDDTISTIFNFDMPASYAGKTCTVVFLFPQLDQLETSSYSFNGQGGIAATLLSSVANSETTYANQPAAVSQNGAIPSLQSGNSYVLSSGSCPPVDTAVSYRLSSTNGLNLEFFQDWNPSPLGLYVVAC